ncbi:MAG: hypothetical protein LLF81_09175 [Porphyromonadaceae bacterium]|nr:hypothetical protein [Porphyromonadaceae bacterium]
MNNIVSVLGIKKELTPIKRDKLRGLNADMLLRFSFYTIDFNNQILCVIQAKNEKESITPGNYKKITRQVETVMNMPVVVLLDSLTYYERERLINQEVYFIISDKYAFLPSLIVNVQAKKRDKNPTRLTPAAQYVLLYYLLDDKNENEFTIKKLEEIVPYNYVTLARAVTSLENCQLCDTEIQDDTGIKFIHFINSKRELWTKAQKQLFSPVKKVLYSDSKPEGNFSISGINALSHYSHLNPEQYETLAIWDKHFNQADGQYNEIEGLYKVEIWKYPTSIPYQEQGGIVDKLSLYLSMKDDPDSRIEKELEIMIEEMKW